MIITTNPTNLTSTNTTTLNTTTHSHAPTNPHDAAASNISNDTRTLRNETNNDTIRNSSSNIITNVKIVGLNVCGLRSKLGNGPFEVYAKKYDILCLSETYCDYIDLSNTILKDCSCFGKKK